MCQILEIADILCAKNRYMLLNANEKTMPYFWLTGKSFYHYLKGWVEVTSKKSMAIWHFQSITSRKSIQESNMGTILPAQSYQITIFLR